VPFPTSPDPSWAPETPARFGWNVESHGPIPGMPTCIALWAGSLAGAVPAAHLLTAVVGPTAGYYAAAVLGTVGIVAGARHTLHADTANHPPTPDDVPAAEATVAAVDGQEECVLLAAEIGGDR
jgi:hypothetical protein